MAERISRRKLADYIVDRVERGDGIGAVVE